MASIYPKIKNGKIVSFKFKAFLGRDEQGKQIVKCKTWKVENDFPSKKLMKVAQLEADLWEENINSQTICESPKINYSITFSDFSCNVWLKEQINDINQRDTTISQKRDLTKILNEYFKNQLLKDITCNKLNKYFEYLKYEHVSKKNKPYSPTTIRHFYRILNLIFKFAVERKYLLENPLNNIKPPKILKHKVDALSKDEVKIFFNEVEKLPLQKQVMYTLLLTTGIRRGELFGLQWNDFDFKNNTMNIERNATYTKTSGVNVGLPKTNMSIRTIPLTDKMIKLLKQYYIEESKLKNICGKEFLFHSANSFYKPKDPTKLTKQLKSFIKKINLPDMSPHDLRHTCGSLLVQGGTDIKSVQDILGHSDASTTLNFYVRSDIEKMRTATQNIFSF